MPHGGPDSGNPSWIPHRTFGHKWALLVFCFGLVIGAEMNNTAIERTVDLAMPHRHPLAKAAKDIAAGAVLVAAATSAVVGMLIFIPHFFG